MDDIHDGEYRWAGHAALSLTVLVGLAALGLVLLRPDFSAPESEVVVSDVRSATSVASPRSTSTSTTATTTTVVALDTLEAGLSCRQLKDLGRGYEDAVRYWNRTGQPEALDEDADGAPCETLYTDDDVVKVLGTIPPDESTTTTTTLPGDGPVRTTVPSALPPGLGCAQLRSRGQSAADAVAYYLAAGSPGRMDADHNGVPCETVYADAAAAWRSRNR